MLAIDPYCNTVTVSQFPPCVIEMEEGGTLLCSSHKLTSPVTDRPHALEDPAVQALQRRAHKIAEDKKAQQAEERAEDADIVGRLVSATTPSEFRKATGAPPQQYTIRRRQKSCD